jgi:drug/metabolite transporter (DMT)-like permease
MIGWGFVIFIGLAFVFWDMNPVTRARLLGSPMLIHAVVIGSGLIIHGGSSNGAMAAIVSGVFSAIYVRVSRRMYGYITKGEWHPGVFRQYDPRTS